MYLLLALTRTQIPVLMYCTSECALFSNDDKNLNVYMSNELMHIYSGLDRKAYVTVRVPACT